ncbi:hypothetical protein JTE90_023232 [Oedothorax gibbosus]|uniref:Uncharacterized protein n=1 Tax=Oedothorax gibbosus TaxID=931172 RepID=A0AAV6TP19_9ARAC|nr:hypothetical protein JTE90_023232 [Oedothorax gibbosus]
MKGWLEKDEDVANNGSEAVGSTLDRDFDVSVGVTIDQDDVANNESGAFEATMDQDNGTSIDMTLDLVDDGSVHEAEERLVDDSENGSMDQDNDGSVEEPLDRVDVGSVKRTVDRDDDGSSIEVSMAEDSNATHKKRLLGLIIGNNAKIALCNGAAMTQLETAGREVSMPVQPGRPQRSWISMARRPWKNRALQEVGRILSN